MDTLKIDNGKATLADTSFVVPRPTLAVLCIPFILYAFDFAKKCSKKMCNFVAKNFSSSRKDYKSKDKDAEDGK